MTAQIVTIDGPGGTGKSTVSREVARRSGLPHLDTGAFYRAATLAVVRSGVEPADEAAVTAVVDNVEMEQAEGVMFLDGEDVSVPIRQEGVTSLVSVISAHPQVRRLLVEQQRAWVARHGGQGVVEGRDIGSVVFPEASVKIYLDASPAVRAERRALQEGARPDRVIGELQKRDHLDSTRTASPLEIPEGAIVVDTSALSFEEVVEKVLSLIPD